MAYGILFETTATSTVLFLLVLLQAALVWEEVRPAPAKRNDILAGTEFLSVFINGAMASPPQRRRGFRRGGHNSSSAAVVGAPSDSATSESQQEASIYRISRNPNGRSTITRMSQNSAGREEIVRFYPISQRTSESGQQQQKQGVASTLPDDSTIFSDAKATTSSSSHGGSPANNSRDRIASRWSGASGGNNANNNATNRGTSRQKVIGVSVTSTVEATPYKVRVEHYDSADTTTVTRSPRLGSSSTSGRDPSTVETSRSTSRTTQKSTSTTSERRTSSADATSTVVSATTSTPITTPLPARLVTEELSNIVSESNRSEFSVDEGSPRTSWRHHASSVTPRPTMTKHTSAYDSNAETTEENYELPEVNAEPKEIHEEPMEIDSETLLPQGRKAGRHYDATQYNRPPSFKYQGQPPKIYKSSRQYGEPAKVYSEPEKVYGEPAKVYSEPAKIYSEPAKVYSEPAKVYSEPAKIYGEPEKVYGEPSKVYSEPAKIYSEPAKVYSQPSKVYGEPSQVYDSEGQPVRRKEDHREPDEQNYEIDESVSVGSNGNIYGPQLMVTKSPNSSDVEDGRKIGYVEEGRNYRKYRVEERTPDGFIVGEYGVVSHNDGSLRGVRYTADGTIDPRLIYDALMKFLAL